MTHLISVIPNGITRDKSAFVGINLKRKKGIFGVDLFQKALYFEPSIKLSSTRLDCF